MSSKVLAPLILALMTPALAAAAEPPQLEWTVANAPGVQLLCEETRRSLKRGQTEVCHLLRTEGLPRTETYWLYLYWMDRETTAMPIGFSIDDQGSVYLKEPGDFVFCTNSMLRGEALRFALLSQESGSRAFGKVISFPIETVGAGGCRIALELVTAKSGGAFALWASGFKPGEEVEVVSRSGREVLVSKSIASEEGSFVQMIMPGVRGQRGGTASVTVTGETCTASLTYEWGRKMKLQ